MNWDFYDLIFRIENEPDLSNYIDPKDYSIEELLDFAKELHDEENYGAAYFYAEYIYNYYESTNDSREALQKPLANQHFMNRAGNCVYWSEQAITGQLLNILSQAEAINEYSQKTKRILLDSIRPVHYKIYKNLCEKFEIVNSF